MNTEDIKRARWALDRLISSNTGNVLFREVLGDIEIAFNALVLEVQELEQDVAYLTPSRDDRERAYEEASFTKPADVHEAIADEATEDEAIAATENAAGQPEVNRSGLLAEYELIVGSTWGSSPTATILPADYARRHAGELMGSAPAVYALLRKAVVAGFFNTAAEIVERYTGCTSIEARVEVYEVHSFRD